MFYYCFSFRHKEKSFITTDRNCEQCCFLAIMRLLRLWSRQWSRNCFMTEPKANDYSLRCFCQKRCQPFPRRWSFLDHLTQIGSRLAERYLIYLFNFYYTHTIVFARKWWKTDSNSIDKKYNVGRQKNC